MGWEGGCVEAQARKRKDELVTSLLKSNRYYYVILYYSVAVCRCREHAEERAEDTSRVSKARDESGK